MSLHRHITMIVLIASVLIGSKQCAAQQDPMYDQYMFNVLAFNPAYAGSADVFTIMALSRHQWVGFEGAPSTQTLVAHTPLRSQALSLGLSFMTDKIGPARRNSFHADFAYRIRVTQDSELAFGLKGGVDLHQAELSSLTSVNADPANVDMKGQLLPNFGFGLFWHSERYYVGVSAPKLLENELEIATSNVLTTALQERHYFLIGGYVLDLNDDLKLKPSFMLRSVAGAPLSLDVNANFLLRERIWFGAMYRIGNSFGLMGQYRINDQLSAGYAFDLTTNRLGAYNAGTHEIMLSYDMRFIQGRTISPRYF